MSSAGRPRPGQDQQSGDDHGNDEPSQQQLPEGRLQDGLDGLDVQRARP